MTVVDRERVVAAATRRAPVKAVQSKPVVALFADRWILAGLHVTLSSLLEHSSASEPFRIVVFTEGLSGRDKALLNETVKPRLGPHTFETRDFVMPGTSSLKALRGNYTTYGRLLLPALLPDADSCLYLDCDLIVTCPIDALLARADAECLIHADGTGVRSQSLDNRSFERLGMDTSKPYFNGGVLVLNLVRWRAQQVSERCLDFAREHRDLLMSADQMVLNAVLGDQFEPFGDIFNFAVWPSSPTIAPSERTGRIFHFIGAPKPWDYLGRFAHRNFAFWCDWVRQTAWFSDPASRIASSLGLRQRMRIMPATLRELRGRYL
jgi:lipopolysaccharide biosynthesis glycosyltransferase